MFEVQTIIGRTYAVSHLGRHASEGFDLCSTTHCQLYEPRAPAHVALGGGRRAKPSRTDRGHHPAFDGEPAEALFHADCGGYTSSAAAVWGGAGRPYLARSADDGAAQNAHARVAVSRSTRDALRARARRRSANARRRRGSTSIAVAAPRRRRPRGADRCCAAQTRDVIVRGEDFREVLDARVRRTHDPQHAVRGRRDGATFMFSGRGFGHGVGLCQAGALARLDGRRDAEGRARVLLSRHVTDAP